MREGKTSKKEVLLNISIFYLATDNVREQKVFRFGRFRFRKLRPESLENLLPTDWEKPNADDGLKTKTVPIFKLLLQHDNFF